MLPIELYWAQTRQFRYLILQGVSKASVEKELEKARAADVALEHLEAYMMWKVVENMNAIHGQQLKVFKHDHDMLSHENAILKVQVAAYEEAIAAKQPFDIDSTRPPKSVLN